METLRMFHEMHKEKLIRFLEPQATISGKEFWFIQSPSKRMVPTLVAHIDTVHENRTKWRNQEWKDGKWVDKPSTKKEDRFVLFDEKYKVMWSPNGLGADDRAGVWGIMKVYESLPDEHKPNLLFTDGEESGGTGAKEAAATIPVELGQSLFFIQLDRKNGKDAVFYNDEPKPFITYITKFGFHKDVGSFSDITILGKEMKLCGVNLSVGYYNNHTENEYLMVESLLATVEKTKSIVRDAINRGTVWNNEIKEKPVRPFDYADAYDRYASGYGYAGGFGCSLEPSFQSRKNGGQRTLFDGSYYPYYCTERKLMIENRTHDAWTQTGSWSRREGKKGKKHKHNKKKEVMSPEDKREIERQERVNFWRRALGLPLSKEDKLDPDTALYYTKPYGGEGP